MEYRIYDQIVYFRVRSQYAAAVFSCEWQHVYSEDHELFMMDYLICARWFIFSMPRERPKLLLLLRKQRGDQFGNATVAL